MPAWGRADRPERPLSLRDCGETRGVLASPAFSAGIPKDLDIEQLGLLGTLVHSDAHDNDVLRLIGPGGRVTDVPHQPRLSSGDFDMLCRLALDGMGVALLPEGACQDEMKSGALVRMFPDWATPEATIHAVFPTKYGLPPAVRAFIDRLARDFPKKFSA
jgi:DNA-binding transcriptional LysR family regulator